MPGPAEASHSTVADSSKRLASRLYQLKTGQLPHRAVPEPDEEPAHRSVLAVPVQEHRHGITTSWCAHVRKVQQKILWA